MSDLIEKLNGMGCDMPTTLIRFLDDEEFYKECYIDMISDEAFEKLGGSIASHNVRESFEYAHMLKGVVANLGITPLFKILVEIVEPLRAGKEDGVAAAYGRLMIEKKKYENIW